MDEAACKPLEGITVVDFSHRLPGPLATLALQQRGAKIIKVEDHTCQDAFLAGPLSSFDSHFQDWYRQLNRGKEVFRLDFQGPHAKEQIAPLIKKADALLVALPPKWEAALGLTPAELMHWGPKAIVRPQACRQKQQSMHDLNALAVSGLLSLYVAQHRQKRLDPPFLPLSGIVFGAQLATDLLAGLLQCRQQQKSVDISSSLYESTLHWLGPLWSEDIRPERTRFLHNGAYPCYSLYLTKDEHYVAVACVEEKFWHGLNQAFALSVPAEQRFDRSGRVFQQLEELFSSLPLNEIEEKIAGKDLCVSPVRRPPKKALDV